jgi:hypothetical protein
VATKTSKRLMADQAFPFLKPHEDVGTYIPGMTLRDYFAAQALSIFLANDETSFQEDAESAYLMADAMLEARK